MGTDSTPLLVNLFPFFVRVQIHEKKLKRNNQVVKIFSNNFRYIDDLFTHNNPTFEQDISNIYPQQLELKRTRIAGFLI